MYVYIGLYVYMYYNRNCTQIYFVLYRLQCITYNYI